MIETPAITIDTKEVMLTNGEKIRLIDTMKKTGETVPSNASIAEVNYELEIDAVNEEIAKRRAEGFLLVRHPSDILSRDVGIIDYLGNTDTFSEIGPREMFIVGATVSMR